MELKDWIPFAGIIGVVVGWGLNQLSQWIVVRREERAAIGRAVADLLEIRFRLLAIPRAVEHLAKCLSMPPEMQALVQVVLSQWFPPDSGLRERYATSIDLIAGINPILGFRLRSQDEIGPRLEQLRALSQVNAPVAAAVHHMEQIAIAQVVSHLEELILDLSRRHGWRTRYRVRTQLKKPLGEIPAALFEPLRRHFENAGRAPESESKPD